MQFQQDMQRNRRHHIFSFMRTCFEQLARQGSWHFPIESFTLQLGRTGGIISSLLPVQQKKKRIGKTGQSLQDDPFKTDPISGASKPTKRTHPQLLTLSRVQRPLVALEENSPWSLISVSHSLVRHFLDACRCVLPSLLARAHSCAWCTGNVENCDCERSMLCLSKHGPDSSIYCYMQQNALETLARRRWPLME